MDLKHIHRTKCGAYVISPYESKIEIGAQKQRLSRVMANDTAGCTKISGGLIIMPPKKVARPHIHKDNEIVLFIAEGWGAALVGPDMEPIFHGPGDFLYFPAGCEHVGINLSSTDRIVLAEIRTDPHFNEDVIVLPELEEKAMQTAEKLWKQFESGEILPEAKTQSSVFSYNPDKEEFKENQ
jgi:uncharacterized RmlC-like cupin family protein